MSTGLIMKNGRPPWDIAYDPFRKSYPQIERHPRMLAKVNAHALKLTELLLSAHYNHAAGRALAWYADRAAARVCLSALIDKRQTEIQRVAHLLARDPSATFALEAKEEFHP